MWNLSKIAKGQSHIKKKFYAQIFPIKGNYKNAYSYTSPTPFTLIVEQYQNLMTLFVEYKPNLIVKHVSGIWAMSDI